MKPATSNEPTSSIQSAGSIFNKKIQKSTGTFYQTRGKQSHPSNTMTK
jgi:hypothetical protein